MITVSGAGFVVPAALGDGNGPPPGVGPNGQGPPGQQGVPPGHGHANGQGPTGQGPPGQLRQQAQGATGAPQAGANGNGNGPNGQGPPGQLRQQAQGATGLPQAGANGGGHGHGRGPTGQGPPGQLKHGGNGHGKGAAAHGPTATVASAAPAAAPAPAPAPSPAATPAGGPNRRGHARQGRGTPFIRITSPRPATRRSGSSGTSGSSPTRVAPGESSALTTGGGEEPLTSALGTAPSPSGGSPAIAGALAPGTASIGARGSGSRQASAAGAASRSHVRGLRRLLAPVSDPAGTVIEHFISVIPTGVWIALAVALALAAVAGVAAFRSTRRVRQQAGEVAAVTAAALTDPLTGVLNRRGFMEAAERELVRAGRYGHPMALAFVDIRGLKAVNDTEGHLAGDRLLQRVTMLLRDSARTHDVVGRIGGDELAVLLAEQSAEGAAAMTQRVRSQVPSHRASLGLVTPWDVTVGTAAFPDDGDNLEQLLDAADRRLYEQRGINLAG
jgi:diguanylate cyclase (GGDEF)-like protein